ncbi:V/A-type H+-transporting ATPase subunit I [Methanomicrobium sp. W14]|uniref:V-type ATP synthase subunit I n=1 Tax=Methanomicrobium sp. W14 TaxID=2817839 RepID=UPI001AE1734A|nr:V-type ATP synthase subunit I [Methanomicrobium sp. W14]MBP2133329.1 V/A-type H+-transporting ATPase subunit I [Methanomicrobium sp. W14]
MLTPAKMCRLTLIVHKKYEKKLTERLHESGLIEITGISKAPPKLSKYIIAPKSSPAREISELNSFLERGTETLKGKKKSGFSEIISYFAPEKYEKITIKTSDLKDLQAKSELMRPKIVRAGELEASLEETDENIRLLEEEKRLAGFFVPLNLNFEYLGKTEFLSVKAGFFDDGHLELFENFLENRGVKGFVIEKTEIKCGHAAVVACHLSCLDEVENALKKYSFREFVPDRPLGRAKEAVSAIEKETESLRTQKKEMQKEKEEIKKEIYLPLCAIHEETAVLKSREEGLMMAGSDENLTYIRGWVPEKDRKKLEELCEKSSSGRSLCLFEEPDEDCEEEIPVLCPHGPLLHPFLMLTNLFAAPKYKEIDPTFFLAPVLVVTFGIMLGDIGYGLILTVLSILLLNGAGREDGSVHDLSVVFLACGISSIFFGYVEGGFFGDFLSRFTAENPFPGILNPLEDPIGLLVFSLVFGIIHINAGLILGARKNIIEKNIPKMLKEQGIWFLLEPCAAILLFSFFGWADFSGEIIMTASLGALFAVSVIMVSKGPLGFFSLTGFLGDWLSYSRILALALATVGIAMTINIISGMVADAGPVFVIIAAVICIGGHAANFLLQVLGGFIHSLRLQYVEFFGKFYEGGGETFRPFTYRRRYTVKESDSK